MDWTGATACCVVFPFWHPWQSLHQELMSEAMPCQTQLEEMRRLVAQIPERTRPWTAQKMAARKHASTRGRREPLDLSHRSWQLPTAAVTISKPEEGAEMRARACVDVQPGCAAVMAPKEGRL